MPQRDYDFLVIGQGLAGSLIAWRLIEAGQRVLVIDNGNPAAASRVAAGLINPVTGRRLVREPRADRYLLSARECYGQLAEKFGLPFLHDKAMLRLFDSEDIKRAWQKRLDDTAYSPYIGGLLSPDECGYPQGGFLQQQTAYLTSALLLARLQHWLFDNGSLLNAEFDYGKLHVAEQILWNEYRARHVIFCEGARIHKNPWFNTLPMQPAQGEILTLKTAEALPKWVINGGQWLLPLQDGIFKLGASYVWPTADRPLDEKTTIGGKQILLSALPKLAPRIKTFQLVEHQVGIRPNSKDKRPLIGFHPQYNHLAVFNGFGSKGSMLIPYYSQHFVDVLLTGADIAEDVDIRRFKG